MFEFPDSYREKGKYDFIRRKDESGIPTRLLKEYVEVCARELSVGWKRFQMPQNYNPIVISYTQPLDFNVYFYVLFNLTLSLQRCELATITLILDIRKIDA